MFDEHARVELKRAVPRLGLLAGATGIVIHVYFNQNAYEVELLRTDGSTAGVEMVEADDLQLATDLSHLCGLDSVEMTKSQPEGVSAEYPLDDGPLSAA